MKGVSNALARLPIWWGRHSVQRAPLSMNGEQVRDYHPKFKLRRGRRRRGYSISDELLRGFNVLGLAEGIISLILHGPGKWRALAGKRKKK